ncbi:PAS domain S-box protein [Colwelliaceae bacterium 6441]
MIDSQPQASLYERFFHMSSDMLCIANTAGYFEVINPSFSRVLGYPDHELLANPFIDFIHPDDIEETLSEVQKMITAEHARFFINRYRHNNGHYLTFSWNAYLDQATGQIYAIAQDVTEQMQHKRKLLQLKSALDQETILVETNPQGVITRVNQKFCNISGYSEAELIGKTHKVVNSGHHPKAFFQQMWQTISSGKTWKGLIKNRKKNGDFYYVQSTIFPLTDRENTITGYLAIREDITEKIVTELELTKTLDILTETSNIAKVGGWELNISTNELTWTSETFKILGVTEKDGEKPILPEGLELFTAKGKMIVEAAVTKAIEYGEPYSLEVEAQLPTGEKKWVHTTGKANYRNGKIVTLSGTIQDIHQRKLTEMKYQKERHKSIQNAKFAVLGELSASIAHEINNPLGVISGYAELLQIMGSSASPEKLAEKTNAILKSCDRISHIVKSLRRFSRSDEKRIHELCDLEHIVNDAITLTTPKLKQENITVKWDVKESQLISCNEIEIEQVVVNLINNAIDAIKALENKWIEIVIAKKEDSICLIIKDSGSGIDEKSALRIFEPFYTTKSKTEGTGLGLSITKGIIDDHNAEIMLDHSNEHTCFVIDFPKPK